MHSSHILPAHFTPHTLCPSVLQLRHEMKALAVEGAASGVRAHTDLDARITGQASRIQQLEKRFDAKLQSVSAPFYLVMSQSLWIVYNIYTI